MVYAFTQDVPIDMVVYDRIQAALMERLGGEPPQGLIAHLVIQLERGLRYVDVWGSEEDCERFTEQHLHPVVWGALKASGFSSPPPEPPREPLAVTGVWSARTDFPMTVLSGTR